MMKAEARVLIVGCGAHMRTSLLPALGRSGMLPAATCDPDPDRAGAVARAHGVPAFSSLEEALGAVECDAAVIAVSRDKNGALARACLERGLKAFVEKPPAASAQEARDIARLAEDKKLVAQVGFMKRCAPSYNRARRIAASPQFGGARLLALEASSGPYSSLEAFLWDYGIHYLDLALYLMGPVEEVQARSPRGEGPAAVQVALGFKSGAVGSLLLTTSAGWHEPCERLTIYGPKMRVEVDNVVRVRWQRGPLPESPGEGDEAALVFEPNFHLPQLETGTLALQGYLGEMQKLRLSLAMGFPPPSTYRTAADTLELLEAVLGAASPPGAACPGDKGAASGGPARAAGEAGAAGGPAPKGGPA